MSSLYIPNISSQFVMHRISVMTESWVLKISTEGFKTFFLYQVVHYKNGVYYMIHHLYTSKFLPGLGTEQTYR